MVQPTVLKARLIRWGAGNQYGKMKTYQKEDVVVDCVS
jgi:hypothetical protein